MNKESLEFYKLNHNREVTESLVHDGYNDLENTLHRFGENVDDEKNKQLVISDILKRYLKDDNHINKKIEDYINEYISFVQNMNYDSYVESMLNDKTVFLRDFIEKNYISAHSREYKKEYKGHTGYYPSRSECEIYEKKMIEGNKNIPYKQKVEYACERVLRDGIDSLKLFLFGGKTSKEIQKLLEITLSENIEDIIESQKRNVEIKKNWSLQNGDFLHGTSLRSLRDILEKGLISGLFIKEKIHSFQGNSNLDTVSGQLISKTYNNKNDCLEDYNKLTVAKYGANNNFIYAGDNKREVNDAGLTIIFDNVDDVSELVPGKEDRVKIGIPRKKIKGILINSKKDIKNLEYVRVLLQVVPFYIPLIDCDTGDVLN